MLARIRSSDCVRYGSGSWLRNKSSPCSVQQIGRPTASRMGPARPISSEFGSVTMSGAGSLRSQAASLWISLRCRPSSPRSMETVISPSRRGFTGIEPRAASFSAHSESHRRSSSHGVLRNRPECCSRYTLMPPKKTLCAATLVSSVSVGVYMGSRTMSCPWLFSSAASALSRMQLPQYICAAPAVKAMIFIRLSYRALKRPAGVEMVEQVAFVGLIPTDAVRGNRAQVQAAHIGGGEQARDQLAVVRDGGDDKARTERARDLVLAHRHHAGEREEKFAVGQRMRGRIAQHDSGQQVRAALESGEARAFSIRRGDVARSFPIQLAIDGLRNALGQRSVGEGRDPGLLVRFIALRDGGQ